MFSSVGADIVCDASGNATVYLDHGSNRKANGFIVMVRYVPGTIATGADITITSESRNIPILTKVDAGTSESIFYPRAPLSAVADGAPAASGSEFIPIKDERIKVEVVQGGSGGQGFIEVILANQSPY